MYPLAKLSDLAKIPLTFPFAPPLGASARWPTRQAGADQLFGSYPSRADLENPPAYAGTSDLIGTTLC